MITFAVKVLGTAPGWRHLSGKLTVEMRPRLLHAARCFCFEGAEALAAELPVGLEIAEDPPCASGKIRRVLKGTWVDARTGETVSRTIGAAPEYLNSLLTSFRRDQLKLQLLMVDCPEEDGQEPEICFEVLIKA